MSEITVLDALFVLLLWLCVGAALGVLVGRVFRLGDPHRDVDPEEPRLVDLDSERRNRRRGDVRNGIGGGDAA